MPIAIAAHILSAMIWVGGMFFAYLCLRPAAGALLEQPSRLKLWAAVFRTFFPWVWLFVAVLLASGHAMLFGGFARADLHVHIMQALGIVMMLLFAHAYFAPYRRLRRTIGRDDWQAGSAALDQIRRIIALNLILGQALC